MRSRVLILFVSFLPGIFAKAQRIISLEDAITTSLANNYDIRLSRNDSTLAALDDAFARYMFYPTLNANGSMFFNNNNSKQVLADGTKRERSGIKSSNTNASLNLNWTLFDGMKMFITRKRLGEMVELGEIQIKAQVVNTVAEVMRIYYDIIRTQQQLRSNEENMALSQERLKLAQYKFDYGTGTKADVLQAQIDYNAEKSVALIQQTNINKLKEQLNNLLAIPLDNDFDVQDTAITINPNLTLDSIRNGIDAVNPELLLAQKNLSISNLLLRERKAERYPVVSFNSAYNFSRQDNKTVINPFQNQFNQTHGLNYGFTATVPIFNGSITRRNIKAAELNIEFQQLEYQRTEALLNTSIENAYKDYRLYRETLALEEENIKLVRENLFIARERYRLGVTTFLEMRIAEQSLAGAMFRLIQARYNTKIAEIELMRLRGDLVR
jgi:outer membrane protein